MAEGKKSSLRDRSLSGLVLGPATLLILYWGGAPFVIFSVIAVGLAFHEWVRMARLGNRFRVDVIIGFIYLLIAGATFIDLRLRHEGFNLVAALLVCVWASDIGAYISGKLIGGPKLCPKISPNKTWAGLAGAMLFPAVALAIYVMFVHTPLRNPYVAFSAALVCGAMGQVGDLLISMFKRRVGVKDTGTLIPGHGGVLDRIDSLLLVAPSFLLGLVLWL